MSEFSHVTAPTQYVEAGGVRYAYRRFGAATGVPLLFLQHFRGGLDHWDPAVTDGLAAGRAVILFNNAGVASSGGQTPETIDEMAEHAATFLGALGLSQVDVLGFSMGGAVGQALAQQHPDLVRRLIVAGFRGRTGTDEGAAPDSIEVATRNAVPTDEDFLYLFFEPSEASQAAGRAFLNRRRQRTADVDPPTTAQTMKAQIMATLDWRAPIGEPYADLKQIAQPALIVSGSHDIMIPTENSWLLAQHLPNAQLIIYPDSGHGAPFQYPELFVSQVSRFLDTETPFA